MGRPPAPPGWRRGTGAVGVRVLSPGTPVGGTASSALMPRSVPCPGRRAGGRPADATAQAPLPRHPLPATAPSAPRPRGCPPRGPPVARGGGGPGLLSSCQRRWTSPGAACALWDLIPLLPCCGWGSPPCFWYLCGYHGAGGHSGWVPPAVGAPFAAPGGGQRGPWASLEILYWNWGGFNKTENHHGCLSVCPSCPLPAPGRHRHTPPPHPPPLHPPVMSLVGDREVTGW